ncbi:MAG TPA: BON domain-containing protein [Steroidobacteraceae bacterium]|jgi:osmotically-inducible protein OsmY|nr:BON domain-containing protein [Steroidobacteraceae bacterium]
MLMKEFITALMLTAALAGCATQGDKCGASDCPSDAKITSDVRANLQKHPELSDLSGLQVQTVNHVVYLTGEVSEGLQARIAEDVARQTAGVMQVSNAISISK